MTYFKHTVCRTCPKWNGNTSNEPPAGYDGPSVEVKAAMQCNGSPEHFKSDVNFLLNLALGTKACEVWDITQCEVKDGEQQNAPSSSKTTESEKPKCYDPDEKVLPPDVPNHHLNDGTTLEHLAKMLKYIFM